MPAHACGPGIDDNTAVTVTQPARAARPTLRPADSSGGYWRPAPASQSTYLISINDKDNLFILLPVGIRQLFLAP